MSAQLNKIVLEYLRIPSEITKEKDFCDRLEEIYEAVDKIIKKHKPDIVGVEKLFFAKNVKTAMDVAQARGVIMLGIKKNKIKPLEFTPMQIKQAVAASGAANKKQVGLMVKTILNLNAVPKPDDAADALAVAITSSFYNKKLVS